MSFNFFHSSRLCFITTCFLLVFGTLIAGGCAGVAYAQEFVDPAEELFVPTLPAEPVPPADEFTDEFFGTPGEPGQAPAQPGDPGFIGPVPPPGFNPLDASLSPVDPSAPDTYVPLTPIPRAAPSEGTNLNKYVVGIFEISIGVAAALAVLMIVFNGIKYMTSEAVGSKGAAKEGIMAALQGLGLILFAGLLLVTIDPQLRIFGGKSFLPGPVTVQDPRVLQTQTGMGAGGTGATKYQWATLGFNQYCKDVLGDGWVGTDPKNCSGTRPPSSDCCGYFPSQVPPPSPPPPPPPEPPPPEF